MAILISCETSGQQLPSEYAFAARHVPVGDRHAGYASDRLASGLATKTIACDIRPGLVDVSRSRRHRELHGTWAKKLPAEARDEILRRYYLPYREQLATAIRSELARHGRCVHLSVRTFGSMNNRQIRRADAGVAYDTNSSAEVRFCADWVDDMYHELSMLKVRRNYPRRGTVDSLTRSMRSDFASSGYLGIELQLNRAWVGREVAIRDEVLAGIAESLHYLTSELVASAA